MEYILCIVFAYLCGSIPFGKLVGIWYGVDIQKRGSGNIGFANVQRVLGWRAGIITLGGDILKGILPTLLAARTFGLDVAYWIGLLAIIGHLFPVWLNFRGGKGVATGLGVIMVLQPLAALVGATVYVAGRLIIRNSAASSLLGIVGVLLVGSVLQPASWWQFAVLLIIALWTLRHNIARTVPNYES